MCVPVHNATGQPAGGVSVRSPRAVLQKDNTMLGQRSYADMTEDERARVKFGGVHGTLLTSMRRPTTMLGA